MTEQSLILGLHPQLNLKLVCDVRSGGCNTQVVKDLINLLGEENVLTHDRLHAKTWVASTSLIMGSSNASANGLGFEGVEVDALTEANLLTNDELTVRAAQTWLNETVFPKARRITSNDLAVGEKRHSRNRGKRPLPEHGNLLSLLKESRDSFVDRSIFIWLCRWQDAPDWALEAIGNVQEERDDQSIDYWVDVRDAPPPGSFVLDFNVSDKGIEWKGLWQILLDRHIHKTENGDLLLCRDVRTLEGLLLGSRLEWRRFVRIAAEKQPRSDTWQIADFAAKFIS